MSSVDSSDSYEQDVEQFMELSFANLLCASQFLHDSQLLASVLSPALQNDDDLLYLYGAAADSFREYNWKGMYTKNPKQDPKYHYIKQKYFPPADSQHNDYQLPVGRRSYNQMWLEKYRVTRETFMMIRNRLRPHLKLQQLPQMGERCTVGEQLALCLYFLAHGCSYTVTGEAMNRPKTTVCRCVHRVTRALYHELKAEYIKLPGTVEQLKEKVGTAACICHNQL